LARIGILYDNINENTGDVAIGLSVKKILNTFQVPYEELIPGRFNPKDYTTIIVGGGHLLRPSTDIFYNKFKIIGNHILNSCGIVGFPDDLHYLNDYSYVSVRSCGDKKKLYYKSERDIKVVPCTSMLLEDIENFQFPLEEPSVGIQLSPGQMGKEQERFFIKWISSIDLNVYFLPITHYNLDFMYMNRLNSRIKNSKIIDLLNAREVFTILGRFNYFISCSLHGSMFSYIHNIPFISFDNEKIRFFMQDRSLEKYLFSDFKEMKDKFELLLDKPPNYENLISKDYEALKIHTNTLKEVIGEMRSKDFISTMEHVVNRKEILQNKNLYLDLAKIEFKAELQKREEAIKEKERAHLIYRTNRLIKKCLLNIKNIVNKYFLHAL
jgi:hypothetical protein